MKLAPFPFSLSSTTPKQAGPFERFIVFLEAFVTTANSN